MMNLKELSVRRQAVAVFLLSLVMYGFTLAPGAAPGRSAQVIVRMANLEPVDSFANPLYTFASRCALAIFGDVVGPAVVLNGFSAFCGALAIAFLFLLVAHIPHNRTSEETSYYTPKGFDSVCSAWIAAASAMLCAPMWVASTRAYENTFGLAFMLGTLLLILRYYQKRGVGLSRLIFFLIGLGCNEVASMVLLLPILVLVMGYILLSQAAFTLRRMLEWGGFFLLGASFSLLNAWMFMQTDMYEWAGFSSYIEVVRVLWRDQVRMLIHAVPRVGWMIVSFLSVIPFVLILVPKRAGDYQVLGSTAGSYFLHLVMLVASLFILFEGQLAPWTMLGDRPLLISPYFMAAATLGYVSVYWLIILSTWTKRGFFSSLPYRVLWVVVIGLVLGLGWRNYTAVHPASVRLTKKAAEYAVENIDAGDWLVASSFLNKHLLIEAATLGEEITIINPAAGGSQVYKNYLADQFDQPRYKSLIQAGVMPLVQEMITDTETGAEKMSTLNLPDIYRVNGYRPVPHPLHYSSVPEGESPSLDELFEEQEAFLRKIQPLLERARHGPESPYVDVLVRHISRNANNLGVLAVEEGDATRAELAFNRSLEVNPENASAILNRIALYPDGESDPGKTYRDALTAYVEKNHEKMHLWNLSARHGYVASPEVFAQEGLTWALSGSVQRGLASLEKAKAKLGNRADIQYVLSSLYAKQGDLEESRVELESILQASPQQPQVILRLARLDIREGKYDAARGRLLELKSMEGYRHVAEIELALVKALEGNGVEARRELEEIARLNSDDARAWVALAAVSVDLKDSEDVMNKAMTHILKAKNSDPATTLQFAQLQVHRKDYRAAAKTLSYVLRVQPNNIKLLEYALEVDRLGRLLPEAREHVGQLLALDSRNAVGNRMMGSIQMHDGHYALAENSFRVSIETEEHINAMIDIAWLLQRRGEFEKALEFADRAIAINPDYPSALHTRGLIYHRLGRQKDASADLLKSLSIQVDNPFAKLYLAMVYAETGEVEKARELVDVLEPLRMGLPVDLQEELSEVTSKILRGGGGSS